MNTLVYDGKVLNDFTPYIFGLNNSGTADKAYKVWEVEGLDGDLIQDLQYFHSVDDHSYLLIFTEEYIQNVDEFRDYISSKSGYLMLTDSEYEDYYFLAKVDTAFVPEYAKSRNACRITLNFKRKPQRYLLSGEQAIQIEEDTTMTITNPTYKKSKPLIKVVGIGTFTVNGEAVHVTANAGNLMIDCEKMDCYEYVSGNLINRNLSVELPNDFIEFTTGNNVIVVPEDMELEIKPRWWRS